jgi:hypothetical protein
MFNESWVPNNAAAITPSNTTILNCTAIYVGGAGNLVLDMENADNVTFSNVVAGSILWVKAVRVKTATTATNLVALF